MSIYSNHLVDYFKTELREFRDQATLFGLEYPQIAAELRMSEGKSSDPHIEHLIQSFTWLASRLHFRIDRNQELIPQILLQQLCPNLVSPIPSITVAQMKPKADGADFSQGQTIGRHRQCFSNVKDAQGHDNNRIKRRNNSAPEVRFRTGYETRLWPISVTHASKVPLNEVSYDLLSGIQCATVIDLDIQSHGIEPLNKLNIENLMFYIDAGDNFRWQILDMLQNNLQRIAIVSEGDKKIKFLPPSALKMEGFEPEQMLFKQSNHTLPAYDLLLDYFFFPEKFCFFSIEGLETLHCRDKLKLLFMFDNATPKRFNLTSGNFRLNCVPLTNLFTTSCEPVNLDLHHYEYKLVPDYRSDRVSEIHSIDRVVAVDELGVNKDLTPFLGAKKLLPGDDEKYYWLGRTQPSQRKNQQGTETYMSFFNSEMEPAHAIKDIIHVEATCTNRDLPEHMRKGDKLKLIGEGPVEFFELLRRPTAHRSPSFGGWQLWQLVAQSSLYRASLLDPDSGLESLKTILALYSDALNPGQQRQIHSIKKLLSENTVMPHKEDAWRGFLPGLKLNLEIDEKEFEGGSLYLFAKVLHHFFALYSHLNCFTQLEINGEPNQWPPLAGLQTLL